jgi:hypothetical protein
MMWEKTRETRLELIVENGEVQIFHHLVYLRQVDGDTTLRLNVHSLNDKRKALVHLQHPLSSRLLHAEEDNTEMLENFVRKMKVKSDLLIEKPKKVRRIEHSINWTWEQLDSELTEFGVEESWLARWKHKANPKLRPIQLHINWFRGNLCAIPSFASIEVVRKDANNLTELHYIEIPMDPKMTSREAQNSIEAKVEDLMLTPMDHLHQLLVRR